MNKLITTTEESLPIKALPSDEARSKIVLELGIWLDGILSLDGDKSIRRLEVLLPIIKDEAWGMSLKEIKEAFTMYVKSELMYNNKLLEPRDNFLTVILFNKILQAYRDAIRNKKPRKVEDIEKLKRLEDYTTVINLFDHYFQEQKIPDSFVWVYDYLESKLDDFVFTTREKQILMNQGGGKGLTELEAKTSSKLILIKRYFDKLNAKDIHLNTLINYEDI